MSSICDLDVNELEPFDVCFFKDVRFRKPHYYLVVPISDDTRILLIQITSKVERKKKYYSERNSDALSGLVEVDQGLPFLRNLSILDCHSPNLYKKVNLENLIDKNSKGLIRGTLPEDCKQQVLDGIKNSSFVKGYIKKLICSD